MALPPVPEGYDSWNDYIETEAPALAIAQGLTIQEARASLKLLYVSEPIRSAVGEPYYRPYNIFTTWANRALLPAPGRPWSDIVPVADPQTIQEALPQEVLVQLESWYDGSDGSSFIPTNPPDGSTFTQWTDKSAYAHNANPIGGVTTRPTYQTNELNGLSVVRFDGTDGLSINPYAALASTPVLTIFVVMKMTTTAGNPRIFTTNIGDTEFYYNTTASKFVIEAAGGVGTSTVANDSSAYHIHAFAYNGTQSTNEDKLKYRYNKTNIPLTFTGTVGATLSSSTNSLFIGNNKGANFYTGDIAEMLIFTYPINDVGIQNVENYLSNKWGL